MVVKTRQLVHRYRVFLCWWHPFFVKGPSQVAGVLRPILGCCTGIAYQAQTTLIVKGILHRVGVVW